MKKRYLSLILTLILIFCSLFVLSVEADNEKLDLEQPDINESVTAETSPSSYDNYLESNQDYEYAKADIKFKVDKKISENQIETVMVEVPTDGLYNIKFSYKPVVGPIVEITFGLKIDGLYPFDDAERLLLKRFWTEGEKRTDETGNQYAGEPQEYTEISEHTLADVSGMTAEQYLFYFSAGTHTVEIEGIDGAFDLESIELLASETTAKYKTSKEKNKFYSGKTVIIEGEEPVLKNSYWLSSSTDNSSVYVSPNSPYKSLVNYVGGANWQSSGDTIFWETPELEAGYYNLAFSYKQETNVGSSVYRWLRIDGKTPFSEAKEVPFSYAFDWEKAYFADKNNVPYLIYLSAGKHQISLTATPGKITEVIDILNDTVNRLSDLYVDITMITGQSVDVYRDYDLFDQIPDMDSQLRKIMKGLNSAVKILEKTTVESTSSQISVLDNMRLVVSQMLDNKYSAQKYISSYYSNYCSVAATLSDLRNMPLSIDRIFLSSPQDNVLTKEHNFIDKIMFSATKFIASFAEDYATVDTSDNSLEVWVNWGRDQAQVLDSLIKTSFTPKHNTNVKVKVVNASLVQAVLSGNGPDIFLQHSRSEPVNLAMRGVLYNLSDFDDVDEVLTRFRDGADIPYRYKGDLYALPDTQSFYLMYYRTDIFKKLGLEVPKTWEEFKHVSKQLSRNNLYTWIPFVQITDPSLTNNGVGSLSLFPSLMMQNGLSLYSEDQRSSSLTDEKTIQVFSSWTDYYTKMKFSVSMNFYNRFRTGTCPLGIDTIATYTTLKAAASEIDGMWEISVIPGTVQEDGSLSNASSGGGTACGIMKSSKEPKKAWEFLKWWTEKETQLSYSNNVESILGPSARVSLSNVEAFKEMSWDVDMKNAVYTASEQIEEVPEVPGSYYLARAIDHSFWNVVNANKKPKNMLLKWGKEVDDEIARKWYQYDSRN